jgi:hypothetical protein
MLLKVNSAEPSRTEINLAIADIVEAEYAAERAEAEKRDATARWVAQNLHSDKTTALGKCIAVVPLRDDMRLQEKYGRHMFEKSFWRYYQKHHKEMCPAAI